MSAFATGGVCRRCARRAWLLAHLTAPLDRTASDPARLWPVLALADEELIEALGGERRELLRARWRQWKPKRDGGEESHGRPRGACRHHCAYPARLTTDPLAPHALTVAGDVDAFANLGEGPVVALVGTPAPSEYAIGSAGSLAYDLARGEVTIACADDELGARASSAALDAGGRTILVGGSGGEEPDRARAAVHVRQGECRVAELLPSGQAPAWARLSHQRILALLADLVIVVETIPAGEDGPREPACIELARWRGTRLAAVPDRLDSPLSEGTNTLILEGASPVVSAAKLLDALHGVGSRRRLRRAPRRTRGRARSAKRPARARAVDSDATACEPSRAKPAPAATAPALEPRLATVLARVEGGENTLARLCAGESACEELALALTELELLGALRRTPEGSYAADAAHLG